MLNFSENENRIIIKGNIMFIAGGVVAAVMAFGGIKFLFELFVNFLYYRGQYDVGDYIGLVFMCFWVSVALGMSFYSFKTGSQKIIIDDDGILSKTWFDKKTIKWSDIKDWGLSYCGQTRGEGNTYYLYFSEHECEVKNECRKKLKGKMIKTIIFEDDYSDAVNKIIPFCADKTSVVPFVGRDKFHVI